MSVSLLTRCTKPEAPQTAAPAVSFNQETGLVAVMIHGKPFTAFHYEEKWDKPFLHPIRDIAGVEVSRGFPLEIIEGESNDHTWHRGIIYGHGIINGVDFWREQGRDKTGRIVPKAPPKYSATGETGTIACDLDLLPPNGKSIGSLREEFTFSEQGTNRIIDVHITILADQGVAVKMGDTEDGGLGLRFKDEFRQDRGATLLNSDGLVGTENIWGKRAKWVDYSTTLAGKKVGVAMFDHPANPRYPTYWHARGYGLCAANPFGLHDFLGDDTKDGSMTIAEGEKAEFRYRVIVHQGDAEQANVEQLYAAYAGKA